MALAGLQFSIYRTWNNGDTLTAPDLVASFNQFINSTTLATISGDSPDLATMRTISDPTSGALCTTLEQEIQRLRFQIKAITKGTYWYTAVSSTPVASGAGIRDANSDLLDRNSNPMWACVTDVNSATSSAAATTGAGFSVTSGDILFIESNVIWTAGANANGGISINISGVTSNPLSTVSPAINFPLTSGSQYQFHLFGIFLITSSGTAQCVSTIAGASPTSITNKIGWAFIKKQ